jgi:hypothetical protein
MSDAIERLYLAVEQMRDIITGRGSYDNDTECLDNIVATFKEVDELTEQVMAEKV